MEEKVCRGCFAEWESGNEQCPKCGWKPGQKDKELFGWKTGDVLDKRYLVGKIFCISAKKDAVVWRLFDNLLGIACFALLIEGDDRKRLKNVADHIQAGMQNRHEIVIQALKKVGCHITLILSMQNPYMEINEFQRLTNTSVSKKEEPLPEPVKDNESKQALPAGTCLASRYKVIDCIGIGGFGITYLCEDIALHRLVALKEYYPAQWSEREDTYVAVKSSDLLQPYRHGLKSFFKEIKITAKFMHTPHLVTIYDAFEANDTAYMVMEYLLGISVGREMRTRGYKPYSLMEVTDILFPVMDALEVMHDRKIIHSDVSPGNIMVTDQREIYLIDMGAAKYNIESQLSINAAFLKIDYAAPEQYQTARQGKSSAEGPWTDIYALGATMYYLLMGRKPPDVIRRLNGEDTDLSEGLIGKLPVEWIELLQKTMELEPVNRISTVSQLRGLLQKIL